MANINRVIAICYIVIQVSVALFISIIGAFHVKRCIDLISSYNCKIKVADHESDDDESTNIDINEAKENIDTGFLKLWLKTIWKMRSVYSGLAVHSFDVLTDTLVIVQWLQLQDIEGDNINPEVMAYSAISVLIASKAISTIAIYTKEGNVRRALFQFCDILIFEEIYESHQKITSQFKETKSILDKDTAIESTLSFKYVRNFEAVFESIPQSVLQLVYIMRIPPSTDKYNPIFIISVTQSFVSMTNAIINNDYSEMQDDRYKKFKQRLPPTREFFKHAIFRLSEVVFRIGLLSLFWTVCGGLPFGILLAIELFHMLLRLCIYMTMDAKFKLNGDTLLLFVNSLIVIPAKDMYSGEPNTLPQYLGSIICEANNPFDLLTSCCFTVVFLNCCFCGSLAAVLTTFIRLITDRNCDTVVYDAPTMKIGVSLMELIFIIFYGLYGQNGENKAFLVGLDHGLSMFIVTCLCLCIYSQYLVLFPTVSLPLNVSVRSKWGYAYSNELSELKKIRPKFTTTTTCTGAKKTKPKKIRINDRDKSQYIEYEINSVAEFWDEPYKYYREAYNTDNSQPITAAMFALAKGNYDIVQWLEDQGAVTHSGMDGKVAIELIERSEDAHD